MLSYSRNVSFTITEANQNILTIAVVKNAIKDRLNIDDVEYERKLKEGGFDMKFDLFCSATTISINM